MPIPSRPIHRAVLMDGLLLLMVLIWGGNYSLAKATLAVLPPRPFNALRLVVASASFLALMGAMWGYQRQRARPAAETTPSDALAGARAAQGSPTSSSGLLDRVLGISRPTAADWRRLIVAGLVGHTVYQLFFIEGLARTSAANAALLIGCSPIVVSIASAIAGHDRLARAHWAGLLLSFSGVYLVVGRHAHVGTQGLGGDLLMLGAVLSWAVYAILSRSLLERHSPLFVTGWTMVLGTMAFVALVLPDLWRVDWRALPSWAWNATVLSSLAALTLAYLIYYVSVMRIGVARTTVWSNVVPIVGMSFAWATLGERVDGWQAGGAALILAGVVVSRLAKRPAAPVDEGPAE